MHAISVTMETTASSGTEFVSVPLLLVKDEPQDDPEMADSNFLNDARENTDLDPMNLLDPVQEIHTGIVPSGESGSQQQQMGPTKEIWQAWMAEFPWLLHEDDDDHYGYCLYCNIKSSYKLMKTPRHHGQTRNHLENEANYLAFKESEDHANLSAFPNSVTIKQEFGTDSDISAIKFKRMSQTELLFNFNWRRWRLQHPWLERGKDDMTHGYCKYCKKRLNVEYSYMRMRHELCLTHKIAVRQFEKATADNNGDEVGSSSEKPSESEHQDEEESGREDGSDTETGTGSTGHSNKDSDHPEEANSLKRKRITRGHTRKNPWLVLHNNSPLTCHCKLCNIKMYAGNFRRHLRSRIHLESERNLKKKKTSLPNVKQEFVVKPRNWKMYAKKHPWLIEDPDDASFAYCKYCKKRLQYGTYVLKRLAHEQSAFHVNSEKTYRSKLSDAKFKAGTDEGSDNKKSSGLKENLSNSEVNSEEEEEEEEENSEDDEKANKSKSTRLSRGSDEWFAAFPWCERYKDDPEYMYCTYCQLKLRITFRRRKHEISARHREGAKQAVITDNKSYLERSKKDKRIRYYPWLAYTKNPNFIYCKYCRLLLNIAVSRRKHQSSKRHKALAANFRNDPKHNSPTTTVPVPPEPTTATLKSKPVVVLSQLSSKTSKVLWKNRFAWLMYKRSELQPNYGYCKYCETRVFLPTEKYAARHQKSVRHLRMKYKVLGLKVAAKHSQNEKAKKLADDSEKKDKAEKYSWMIVDKDDHTYGFCKYCDIRLNISGCLKDRHEATLKHAKAKEHFLKEKPKEGAHTEENAANKNSSTPVVVIEDEESNEAISVKSEPVDGDDVIKYILQRSQSSGKHDRNTSGNDSLDPARKRQKVATTQQESLIDRAKRLTAAHLEILRLTRHLNENKFAKSGNLSLPSTIFNTSAAIATLLSPQRSQPAPAPAPSPAPAPPPPPPAAQQLPSRNNFELFFDSVCESVKTLPSDLAAEGKIKIAQLVADLELRALQRSQSKDMLNTSKKQQSIVAQGMSTNISSPTLSGGDMPTTTTNGLEKDETSVTTPVEVSLPVATSSSSSFESSLQGTPMSSTPYRPTPDVVAETSSRRPQTVDQQSVYNIKRLQVIPISKSTLLKSQKDLNAFRGHTNSSDASPTAGNFTSSPNQYTQTFSSPSQASLQSRSYTQPYSSPDSGGLQRITPKPIKTLMQNSVMVDNGFQRIQLAARPNQRTSNPKVMGFRRIHIPLKNATASDTSEIPKLSCIKQSNNPSKF